MNWKLFKGNAIQREDWGLGGTPMLRETSSIVPEPLFDLSRSLGDWDPRKDPVPPAEIKGKLVHDLVEAVKSGMSGVDSLNAVTSRIDSLSKALGISADD